LSSRNGRARKGWNCRRRMKYRLRRPKRFRRTGHRHLPKLWSSIWSSLPPRIAPFSGYGDDLFIESTRSEKSGSKDWNLLGLRGAQAVQVSSHRGPPTDRPPDKPLGVSVFAGCSEERPNTCRFHQLASFTRSSHCSSGNVSSLADNANLGSHAI
jgi:hypothetical protein